MKKNYSLNKLKKNKTKLILFIASLLLFSLVFNKTGIYSYLQLRSQKSQLQETQDKLTIRENNLKEQIEQLQTDSLYIEKLIRKKLKKVNPGEKTFLIQNK